MQLFEVMNFNVVVAVKRSCVRIQYLKIRVLSAFNTVQIACKKARHMTDTFNIINGILLYHRFKKPQATGATPIV